jgi:class 3 adenylate cyclase
MSDTRKLAAILVADVVGYLRLAGVDEDRTLARLRGLRSDLIDPAIAAHHGRIVKRTGDGSIIEFRSVVDAVRCAIEVQDGLSQVSGEHEKPLAIPSIRGQATACNAPFPRPETGSRQTTIQPGRLICSSSR